jgi:hypothetical protein
MKLSNGERLILIMVSEIYEKLDIKGEINPALVRDAIYGDKLWALGWEYDGLLKDEEPQPPALTEVLDILDMWRLIEPAYATFSPTDKAAVTASGVPHGDDPKFRGFDGNNESEHMSIADFLIHKLNRYSEFDKRYLNSHSHTLHSYRAMLRVFKRLRPTLDEHELTPAQLIEILAG